MQRITKFIIGIFVFQLIVFVVFHSSSKDQLTIKTKNVGDFFAKDDGDLISQMKDLKKERRELIQSLIPNVFKGENLLEKLGAYPEVGIEYFELSANKMPSYDVPNFQLIHDDDYCEMVDWYNFAMPENMFQRKVIFTDLSKSIKPRTEVIDKIGIVSMDWFSTNDPETEADEVENIQKNHKITNFFVNHAKFYFHHEIGKDFLCATQMYNRIPGHDIMVRKDLNLMLQKLYRKQYQDKPRCLSYATYPKSYLLSNAEDCQEFFTVLNSKEYRKRIFKEPFQFLLKVGNGVHQSSGVGFLGEETRMKLNQIYDHGKLCGRWGDSLVAQTYILNPLLLDMDNKFDFRIYMLVASTNPLIAYYHDGFIRVALSEYDKQSTEKGVHLTNTHIAQEKFDQAKKTKVNGMTEQQLKDYHLWTLEELRDFLLETGKIDNKNWLNDYLRPEFKKTIAHLVRMSKDSFWKGSNVYQLFGLDFMLDDDLKLWYIEANPNPQLHQNTEKMSNFTLKMLMNMFDIQYAYYKSRMKRLSNLIKLIVKEAEQKETKDYRKWQHQYNEAVKNYLEPEYGIRNKNSFVPVIDENLQGAEAYFGLIPSECF